MICKCGAETGIIPHLDDRACWAEMCRRVQALEQRVRLLESGGLVGVAKPTGELVEDLGHGWQVVRYPQKSE